PGAAARRIEDRVRQGPAELFRKLEAHGLLALDAIGLLEGRGIEPAHRLLALGNDLGAIVDQAVHLVELRTLQDGLADIGSLRVVRAEDVALDARTRAVSG